MVGKPLGWPSWCPLRYDTIGNCKGYQNRFMECNRSATSIIDLSTYRYCGLCFYTNSDQRWYLIMISKTLNYDLSFNGCKLHIAIKMFIFIK